VRKLFLALAVAGFLVMVPAAMAAIGARLAGTFDVTGTIKENDFGIPPGTKTPDVWKFTGCRRTGCRRVNVDRDGGNHAHYKSTLRKVRRGVYKGTEGPYPYDCPDNAHSTFTAAHTVKITKAKDGKATVIGGNSKVKIANCGFASFVNYSLSGKRR
jgi:hypothetical protein